MNSQETKDPQIQLRTSLAGRPLYADLGIPDGTSSMTSPLTSLSPVPPRTHLPAGLSDFGIPSHLASWSQFTEDTLIATAAEKDDRSIRAKNAT
jgi:hypothetical protein